MMREPGPDQREQKTRRRSPRGFARSIHAQSRLCSLSKFILTLLLQSCVDAVLEQGLAHFISPTLVAMSPRPMLPHCRTAGMAELLGNKTASPYIILEASRESAKLHQDCSQRNRFA